MPRNFYQKSNRSILGRHKVENKIFPNLPAIADEYEMSLNSVYKRYSRGCRGDDLVPLEKRKIYKSNNNDYNITEIEFSKLLGISKAGLRSRRRQGKLEGQYKIINKRIYYLDPKKNKHKTHKLYVNGVGYNSYQDACRKNKINYVTFRKRIECGWSLEDALTIPSRKIRFINNNPGSGTARKIIVEGKEFKSIADAARNYGLTPASVVRSLGAGETIEQALKLDIKPTSHMLEYNGKKYRNLNDLATKLNFDFNILKSRIQFRRMSLEKAISLGKNKIKNVGRYNETILKRDKKLSNEKGNLYFAKLLINGKYKYKIGITTKDINSRLGGENFKFKIINSVRDKIENCYKLEQNIHKKFKKFRTNDLDNSDLDGYTEVYDFSADQIMSVNQIFREHNR